MNDQGAPIQTELELVLLKRQLERCCTYLIADWLIRRDETLSDRELIDYIKRISKTLSPIDLNHDTQS